MAISQSISVLLPEIVAAHEHVDHALVAAEINNVAKTGDLRKEICFDSEECLGLFLCNRYTAGSVPGDGLIWISLVLLAQNRDDHYVSWLRQITSCLAWGIVNSEQARGEELLRLCWSLRVFIASDFLEYFDGVLSLLIERSARHYSNSVEVREVLAELEDEALLAVLNRPSSPPE